MYVRVSFHGVLSADAGVFRQQISSFMGVLSFCGSCVLLVFCGIELFSREDYDPLQPVTAMFVYWIVCDLIQAIASMFQFRWAFEGAVKEGTYCRVQCVS